jgi:hypothetical protein
MLIIFFRQNAPSMARSASMYSNLEDLETMIDAMELSEEDLV